MTSTVFRSRLLPSMITICLLLPANGLAQDVAVGLGVGPGYHVPAGHPHGKHHGKYPPPPPYWNYYGLPAGPYLTTGYPFYGYPGYRGAFGSYWTNGLSLYGPPVPVYGPVPGVLGNSDLVHQWQSRPTIGAGFGYVGWFGTFRASPRPHPPTVSVWPSGEPVPGPAVAASDVPAATPGECLHISVKVPQPAAELFVDGVKTAQTGTDRLFESPPLPAGKDYAYEVTARWLERGVTHERKKLVTAKPGEVVRVDLTAPDVVPTGR